MYLFYKLKNYLLINYNIGTYLNTYENLPNKIKKFNLVIQNIVITELFLNSKLCIDYFLNV